MNSIEKYLAKAAQLEQVAQGQEIFLNVDLALAHDGSALKVINLFKEMGGPIHLDPEKIHITIDHALPAPSHAIREGHLKLKKFSKEHGIRLYDQGEGILHQVVAELATPLPGQIIVGADGHVLTSAAFDALAFSLKPEELAQVMTSGKYKITVPKTVQVNIEGRLAPAATAKDLALLMLEKFGVKGLAKQAVIITGEIINYLDRDDKMTLCNLLGEMNIKTALLLNEEKNFTGEIYTLDVSNLKHLVAAPPSPDYVKSIDEVNGKKITQVYIGGCTNGRLKDMEITARILIGKRIHPDVTLIVGPASRNVTSQMDEKGFSGIIRQAGGIIINPGCGACSGAHQGVACAEDIILTTTVRNTSGRMGDEKAQIYMASPEVAAYSALYGIITASKQ